MIYLLDTDICIYWLNGRQEIKDKLIKLIDDDFSISIITLAELQFGAYNSANIQKNIQKINDFESSIDVIELDKRCVEIFAKTKTKLRVEGRMLDDFDILIAATAIANDYILVTNNIKHFERIDELQVEKWIQ